MSSTPYGSHTAYGPRFHGYSGLFVWPVVNTLNYFSQKVQNDHMWKYMPKNPNLQDIGFSGRSDSSGFKGRQLGRLAAV